MRRPSRPARYLYEGLEERLTTIMPEGVDSKLCDVIGKDVVRILHRDPAKLWVEVIERPILRLKSDKNALSPRIYQAKAVRHAHKDSNSCHKDSEVPNPSIYSSEIQEGRP